MKHAQQAQNGVHRKSSKSNRTPPRRTLSLCWPGMHNVLNFARFCIYLAIIAWTVIVLAIAAHFEQMLVSSDLTRFVPLAIFISATTLLVILGLLLAPVTLRHNPVSTLYELSSLALLGVFWIALGAYTASAEMGDVECFADEDETEPIQVPGFSTDDYHAQYRALEGFSLINAFLLLGFLLFMLALAVLQHKKGYSPWSTPMPLFPWFSRRGTRQRPSKLPPPVTSKEPKAVPPMVTKPSAPVVSRPPAPAPAPAAPRPVARAPPPLVRTRTTPAAAAPARAPPVRTQTAPVPAPSAPRPAATTRPAPQRSATLAAATAAASAPRPTPYRSQTMAAATKPKAYSSQYQRPAAGIPQTRAAAPGQSSYLYHVPPVLPAQPPAAATRSGQRAGAAPAAPPRRR